MGSRARILLLSTVAVAALPLGAATARASNVQNGSNSARTSQTGTSQSGDAIGGGQVVGTVGNGNIDLTATNHAEDSIAESGDASGSNTISGLFVGNESTQPAQAGDGSIEITGLATDGEPHPVAALGPLEQPAAGGDATAPAASPAALAPESVPGGAEVLGPPGPLGPTTADDGTGSNVQVGDNTFTYSQVADVRTGAAVAGGQIVGSVQTGNGNVDINVSNHAVNSVATSGQAEMNNTLRDVRVGSLASGPVGPIDSLVPDEMQSAPDPGPLTTDATNVPTDILAAVRTIDAEVTSAPAAPSDVAGAFNSPG